MQLKKNIIFNIVYQCFQLILPLIITPYIARVLSPEGIGMYYYSTSIVTYFGMFILLGVANYGNRSIAEVSKDKKKLSVTFFEIYFFQVILGIIVIAIYFIYAINQKEYILYLIQLIYLIGLIFDYNWLFAGIERFDLTVSRTILIKLLTFCSIFFFVKDNSDLYLYVFIMTVGPLIGQLFLLPFLFRNIKFYKISLRGVLKHIKPNLILFVPIFATSIFTQVDKIMIGNMINTTEVAFYDYSEKIIKIPIGIITAFNTVMMPRMVNLSVSSMEKFKKYFMKSMHIVGFLSIGIFFGLLAISNDFILLFYGENFISCIFLTKIFSLYCLIVPWSHVVRMQYLIPLKKDKNYVLSIVAGAVINFLCNLLLIKKFASVGAIIATILTELIILIVQQFGQNKQINTMMNLKTWGIFLIPGFIMYITIAYIAKFDFMNLLYKLCIEIVVGFTIYCLLVIAIFFVNKKQKKMRGKL